MALALKWESLSEDSPLLSEDPPIMNFRGTLSIILREQERLRKTMTLEEAFMPLPNVAKKTLEGIDPFGIYRLKTGHPYPQARVGQLGIIKGATENGNVILALIVSDAARKALEDNLNTQGMMQLGDAQIPALAVIHVNKFWLEKVDAPEVYLLTD